MQITAREDTTDPMPMPRALSDVGYNSAACWYITINAAADPNLPIIEATIADEAMSKNKVET